MNMEFNGGGGGIRTHGTLSRTLVFKTSAFDHSATPPQHGPHRAVLAILQTWKSDAANKVEWGNLPITTGWSFHCSLPALLCRQDPANGAINMPYNRREALGGNAGLAGKDDG